MFFLRCTTIGFRQKYGHKTSIRTGYADMDLRWKSDFTAKIGQYFVRRRLSSWIAIERSKMTFISMHIIANQTRVKRINQHNCFTRVFCVRRYWPFVRGIHLHKRAVTWSFDVFFDLCLNKWPSEQLIRRWFETPTRLLWHHCSD